MFNQRALIGFLSTFFFLQFSYAQNPTITIPKMEICTAIENRQPANANATFPDTIEQLYCFTRITSTEAPAKIHHIWYHNDEEVGNVELNIGAQAWRTWSSKKIMAEQSGQWRVEVTDLDGKLLKTKSFNITSSESVQNAAASAEAPKKIPAIKPVKSTTESDAASIPKEKPKTPVLSTAKISVPAMEICTAVENRQPVNANTSFPNTVERLFCFTQITSTEAPFKLYHIWYHHDEEINRVELNIGAQAWRTWSAKSIKQERTGKWRVDIAKLDGTVLKTKSFTITPSKAVTDIKEKAPKPQKNSAKETRKPVAEPAAETLIPKQTPKADVAPNSAKEPQAKPVALAITLQKLEICTAVENRQPVNANSVFSNTVKRLYCFTQLISTKAPYKINHIWYHNDEEVSNVELNIGAMSWRFTWSAFNLEQEQAGMWRVEVSAFGGKILETKSFTIEPAEVRQDAVESARQPQVTSPEEPEKSTSETALTIGPSKESINVTANAKEPENSAVEITTASPNSNDDTISTAHSIIGLEAEIEMELPNPPPAPQNTAAVLQVETETELPNLPPSSQNTTVVAQNEQSVSTSPRQNVENKSDNNPPEKINRKRQGVKASFEPALITDVDILLKLMEDNHKNEAQRFNRKKALKALQTIILDTRYGKIWLINTDRETIGYTTLTFGFSLNDNGSYGILDEFYIPAVYNGSDIDIQLLKFMEQEARAMRLQALHLKTKFENFSPNTPYRELGFDDHEEYFMTKRLEKHKLIRLVRFLNILLHFIFSAAIQDVILHYCMDCFPPLILFKKNLISSIKTIF